MWKFLASEFLSILTELVIISISRKHGERQGKHKPRFFSKANEIWMKYEAVKVMLGSLLDRCIHTYIQSFNEDYGLDSHTIYGVCVNFIHEWRETRPTV